MRASIPFSGFKPLFTALWLLATSSLTGCGQRSDNGNRSATILSAPVLLFNGTGTSPNDVKAFESVLKNHHLEYAKADSAQLNRMSELQLREYRLLIVPGGNFIEMGNGLATNTAANIRSAVSNGVNYLGVCSGALIAGNSPYGGLNLTSGIRFQFYSAVDRGIHKAAVPIIVAEAPTLVHYWEDGPQLAGWGAVVGKYPDGKPAIAQGTFGNGWMILSGVHPKLPKTGVAAWSSRRPRALITNTPGPSLRPRSTEPRCHTIDGFASRIARALGGGALEGQRRRA